MNWHLCWNKNIKYSQVFLQTVKIKQIPHKHKANLIVNGNTLFHWNTITSVGKRGKKNKKYKKETLNQMLRSTTWYRRFIKWQQNLMLTAFTLSKVFIIIIYNTEISKNVWTSSTVMPVIGISYRFMSRWLGVCVWGGDWSLKKKITLSGGTEQVTEVHHLFGMTGVCIWFKGSEEAGAGHRLFASCF